MNTLILSGFGTNCERETAYACERSGAAAGSVHVRHIAEIYSGALRKMVARINTCDGDCSALITLQCSQ